MNNKCNFCGGPVNAGDQFCKACGAAVAPAPNQINQVNNQTQVNTYNNQNVNQNTGTGKTPGTAIAALICGIAGFFIAGIPLGIVSISLGATTLNHIKTFPQDKGKGLGIAGIALGIFDIVTAILAIILKAQGKI